MPQRVTKPKDGDMVKLQDSLKPMLRIVSGVLLIVITILMSILVFGIIGTRPWLGLFIILIFFVLLRWGMKKLESKIIQLFFE